MLFYTHDSRRPDGSYYSVKRASTPQCTDSPHTDCDTVLTTDREETYSSCFTERYQSTHFISLSNMQHAHLRCFFKVKIIRYTDWELLNPSSSHILQTYWIYKDAIDLTYRWKVRFRQTFFKMKPKRCSTSQCWSQILLVIFGGVIASQTSGKLENQQNQINPSVPQLHNQSQIKSI